MDGEAYLCDITRQGALRIAGADAQRFMSVMYAGSMEACAHLGEMSQGAFLTSEAEVIDIVSVLRTGDDEFLVTGSADNRAELLEWLNAHAELSDDAGRVFPALSVEDQSAHLGILLMAGQGARRAHEDLLQACAGQLFFLEHEFDDAAYGIFRVPSWVLFVPVNLAPEIGDFLQQYPEFYVLDEEELVELQQEQDAYISGIHEASYANANDEVFAPFIRDGDDFVGARALHR